MTALRLWLLHVFGGLLNAGGMVALFHPTRTFFAIVSILGYMFVIVGIMWIGEAFLARDYTKLWWLNPVAAS